MSETKPFPKAKKITVELTAEEVDVLENMLFCKMTPNELRKNFKIRCSLWKKIAGEFDWDADGGSG